MNKKEQKNSGFSFNIAIIITIILAALKLDKRIDISWMIVIIPIVVNVLLGIIVSLMAMLYLGFLKIKIALKESNDRKHLYTTRISGNPIYWDYITKSFYDVAGNKIDNTVEEEQI